MPTVKGLTSVTSAVVAAAAIAANLVTPAAAQGCQGNDDLEFLGFSWDFEDGALTGWTATGNAFSNSPSWGDNPTARNRGFEHTSLQRGGFWIGGYEDSTCVNDDPTCAHSGCGAAEGGTAAGYAACANAYIAKCFPCPSGNVIGDAPTGTLTSPTFQLAHSTLSMVISGGNYYGNPNVAGGPGAPGDVTVGVDLMVSPPGANTFTLAYRQTGDNTETLKPRSRDISAYCGYDAYVVLRDHVQGVWGHLNLDDLQFSEPCPVDPCVCPDNSDGDGVCDDSDNCVGTPNPTQQDGDGDGVGDACDNCPDIFNPGQEDANNDGEGNACSDDADADGWPNNADNCPNHANADQADSDGDGNGDVCDLCPGFNDLDDVDNDGVPTACDACPSDDASACDGNGDGCLDSNCDTDGDGHIDGVDPCPLDAANDADADGVCGDVDNCPSVANGDQTDTDNDGLGDACDSCSEVDSDSDGICDDVDNCPNVPNLNQLDSDGDGVGNLCDACAGSDDSDDADNDGIPFGCDLCEGDNSLGDEDGDGVCGTFDCTGKLYVPSLDKFVRLCDPALDGDCSTGAPGVHTLVTGPANSPQTGTYVETGETSADHNQCAA